jgi:hypothetical protein
MFSAVKKSPTTSVLKRFYRREHEIAEVTQRKEEELSLHHVS